MNVIREGVLFLRIISPFYILVCMKIVSDGVLKGSGAIRAFMLATFSDMILRVIFAYLFARFFGTMGIWMSWPVGWIVGTSISVFLYKRIKFEDIHRY